MSARLRESKATNAKHAEMLRGMLKKPDNKVCVDCKRNDPRWASTNLGVFMCIRCSGFHRGLGVHISRVRSVDLDTWTPEQIASMERWGNRRANLYWEAHLKEGHQPPEHKMEQFIRSKYESKRWAMEGPRPEPETLDGGDAAASTSQVEATPAQSAPASSRSQQVASALDLLGESFGAPVPAPRAAPSLVYPSRQQQEPSRTPGVPAPASSSSTPAIQARSPPAQPAPSGNGLFDLDFSPAASTAATSATNAAASKRNNQDILSLFGSSTSAPKPANPQPANGGLDAFASLNLGGSSSGWGQPASSAPAPAIQATTPSWSQSASSAGPQNRQASNSISGGNPWAAPASTAPAPTISNNFFSSSPSSTPAASYNSFGQASTTNSFASPTPASAANGTAASSSLDLFNSSDIWGSSNNTSSASKASQGDAFGGFSSGSTANKGCDDLWG